MSAFKSAILTTAALALCYTPVLPARADVSGRWVHPRGAYSVALADLGWSTSVPFSYQGTRALATFMPNARALRVDCVLFESEIEITPPATQERLNRAIARDTGESKATEMGFPASGVVSFESVERAGVTINSLVVDSSNPDMRVYYEYFYLLTESGPRYEELSCQTARPFSAEEAEATRDFLNSLRLPAEGAP